MSPTAVQVKTPVTACKEGSWDINSPSRVRGRLAAVVFGALAAGAGTTAMNDLLALVCTAHAPHGYGLSTSEFSRLLSWKAAGSLVGLVMLQPLAQRLGPHKATTAALIVCGLLLSAFGSLPFLLFSIAVAVAYGALQTALVNLNALCQLVDPSRQAVLNTVYRSCTAASPIVLPVLLTHVLMSPKGGQHHQHSEDAAGSYATAYRGIGISLALTGVLLGTVLSPPQSSSPPPPPAKSKLAALAASFEPLIANRPLVRFMVCFVVIAGFAEVVSAFAVVRLTRKDGLGASEAMFGVAASVSAVGGLVAVLVVGAAIQYTRSIRGVILVLLTIKVAAVGGMGATDSPMVFCVLLVLFRSAVHSSFVPMSMWVERLAARSEGLALSTAFVALKVGGAFVRTVAQTVLSLLVDHFGVAKLFVFGSLLAVPVLLAMATLPVPTRNAPASEEPKNGKAAGGSSSKGTTAGSKAPPVVSPKKGRVPGRVKGTLTVL